MQHHHILIQKSKQKVIQELMETHGLSVDNFKLVIDNHMVDQICFVYTPSTAELSAAWLKMLMIDLDNTGRILEHRYLYCIE